jgi:hypothetical protein
MTAIEWLVDQLTSIGVLEVPQGSNAVTSIIEQAKEMEKNNLLDMLHKFAFDYTYNYRGEKTIYEWIPEWFEEYKRLQEKHKNK